MKFDKFIIFDISIFIILIGIVLMFYSKKNYAMAIVFVFFIIWWTAINIFSERVHNTDGLSMEQLDLKSQEIFNQNYNSLLHQQQAYVILKLREK